MKPKWLVQGFFMLLLAAPTFCQEVPPARPGPGMRMGAGMGPEIGRGPVMPVQIIPTPDGGVIVFSGCQLIKYDKDLNLIKKVTIPLPDEPAPIVSPDGREKGSNNR